MGKFPYYHWHMGPNGVFFCDDEDHSDSDHPTDDLELDFQIYYVMPEEMLHEEMDIPLNIAQMDLGDLGEYRDDIIAALTDAASAPTVQVDYDDGIDC